MHDRANVVIVGAGALGTIIGAHLLEAGHRVCMVARGERARILSTRGLQVRGLSDLQAPCDIWIPQNHGANAMLPFDGECDLLLFAVKTHQMADAMAPLRDMQPANVVSVANGVQKNQQLAELYGADKVLGCMADTSGELHADGVVEFTRNVCLNIGAYQDPSSTTPESVAEMIDQAGVRCRAVASIATVEWSKFCAWVSMFSLSVVARSTTGRYLSEPCFARLAVLQIKEIGELAARLGITLSNEAPMPVRDIIAADMAQAVSAVQAVGGELLKNAPSHRMSSLQDLEAGRRLEVEGTLGYAAELAAQQDLAMPAVQMFLEIARGIDRTQQP